MKVSRRNFLAASASVGAFSVVPCSFARDKHVTDEELEKAAEKPVLRLKGISSPVIIESIELLRKGKEHFVCVRSKDGAEGISVDDGRMNVLHPILNQLVIPYCIGKDARELEEHLFGVYRHESNYKLQGLALWCPVALVEFAILDMLGRMSGQSINELFGGGVRTSVRFYVASGRRDTTPAQEVDYLKRLMDETGAKAVKYRLGGRMDRKPGRDAGPDGEVDSAFAQGARRQDRYSCRCEQFIRSAPCHQNWKDVGGHQMHSLRRAVSFRQFRCDQEGDRCAFDSDRVG